jgi:hypothetical protein
MPHDLGEGREVPSSLTDQFDLRSFVGGLVSDLKELRAGKISARDAHARAELARQVLRGVHYVVTAQKFLEARALPANKKEQE